MLQGFDAGSQASVKSDGGDHQDYVCGDHDDDDDDDDRDNVDDDDDDDLTHLYTS